MSIGVALHEDVATEFYCVKSFVSLRKIDLYLPMLLFETSDNFLAKLEAFASVLTMLD